MVFIELTKIYGKSIVQVPRDSEDTGPDFGELTVPLGENKRTEIIMKQEAMSIEKMCFRDLGGTCNSIGTDSQRRNNVN